MKRWRRLRPLILIALLLLAGAVVNVAVAWVLVGVPGTMSYMDYFSVAPDQMGAKDALQRLDARPQAPFQSPSPRKGFSWGGRGYSGVYLWDGEDPTNGGHGWVGARLAGGWPLRSMTSFKTIEAPDRNWRCSFSLKPPRGLLPRRSGYPLAHHDRLPLQPIPLGFAINTLFYAAILALPLSFFPIRRRLRARRGRCPKCGYDLAGLGGAETGGEGAAPCPECGIGRMKDEG